MRKLKQAEIELLTACQKNGYRYIARDRGEELWVFKLKPFKSKVFWKNDEGVTGHYLERVDDHWFKDIVLWEDKEPTLIAELLEEGKQ